MKKSLKMVSMSLATVAAAGMMFADTAKSTDRGKVQLWAGGPHWATMGRGLAHADSP